MILAEAENDPPPIPMDIGGDDSRAREIEKKMEAETTSQYIESAELS